MKEVAPNVDFADASYKSCTGESNDDLIVYLNSWDDKIIEIKFVNAIQFIYRGGSYIEGVYERTDESSSLSESLASYYEKIPKEHPFKILISSDLDYNELCAEFFFEDQFVGILTQERGFENLEIEIHSPPNQKFWIFKFSEFEAALNSAKNALWEMQKPSSDEP